MFAGRGDLHVQNKLRDKKWLCLLYLFDHDYVTTAARALKHLGSRWIDKDVTIVPAWATKLFALPVLQLRDQPMFFGDARHWLSGHKSFFMFSLGSTFHMVRRFFWMWRFETEVFQFRVLPNLEICTAVKELSSLNAKVGYNFFFSFRKRRNWSHSCTCVSSIPVDCAPWSSVLLQQTWPVSINELFLLYFEA